MRWKEWAVHSVYKSYSFLFSLSGRECGKVLEPLTPGCKVPPAGDREEQECLKKGFQQERRLQQAPSAQSVSDRFAQRMWLKSFRVRVCLQAGRGPSGFALSTHRALGSCETLAVQNTPNYQGQKATASQMKQICCVDLAAHRSKVIISQGQVKPYQARWDPGRPSRLSWALPNLQCVLANTGCLLRAASSWAKPQSKS